MVVSIVRGEIKFASWVVDGLCREAEEAFEGETPVVEGHDFMIVTLQRPEAGPGDESEGAPGILLHDALHLYGRSSKRQLFESGWSSTNRPSFADQGPVG